MKVRSALLKTTTEVSAEDDTHSQMIMDSSNSKEYLILLNNNYVVTNIFEVSADKKLSKISTAENLNPLNLEFRKYDGNLYKNQIKHPEVRYFETPPSIGLPGLLPIDIQNGWYVKLNQDIPGAGNIASYLDSKGVQSFTLCNVMEDGRVGDNDECMLYTSPWAKEIQGFHGLTGDETKKIISNVQKAVNDAVSADRKGKRGKQVSIDGQKVYIGEPITSVPDAQCQDFMSPSDCNKLFNVCDPVICPSSRCNLGGNYYVSDVVQTGIIGGLTMCYANRDEVKVPICLSAVNAGLETWIKIQGSYKSCLETSLETGETVGICDQVHSIYACDMFWKQTVPVVKSVLPNILANIMGQGNKGGGEYLKIQSALANAENSVDYMVNYYGGNAYKAFQARSTSEVQTDLVCKAYASLVYPSGGNFLDRLLKPDVPYSVTAYFDEIPLTTATVIPMSHYKVSFFIFAGNDQGAYYNVYLKSTSGDTYYQNNPTFPIATGYIEKGSSVAETPDFPAPSGYKELCVNVNGQTMCGFKQVSTSFAVNYIEDKYLSEQASQTDIESAEECVLGSKNGYALLNPNLQSGVEEAINPDIASRGIQRVCATSRPDEGVVIVDEKTNRAKWEPVGYCDSPKNEVRCWLNTESVADVIEIQSLEGGALEDIEGRAYSELEKEGYLTNIDDILDELDKLEKDPEARIRKITDIYNKVLYSHHKANLLFLRAQAYGILAFLAIPPEPTDTDTCPSGEEIVEGECIVREDRRNREDTEYTFTSDVVYIFEDGGINRNICYTYDGGWKYNPSNLAGACTGDWYEIKAETTSEEIEKTLPWTTRTFGYSEQDIILIERLKDKSYKEGVQILVEKTVQDKDSKLKTTEVEFSSEDNLFLVMRDKTIFVETKGNLQSGAQQAYDPETVGGDIERTRLELDLHIKYEDEKWKWSFDEDNWMNSPKPNVSGGKYDGITPSDSNRNLVIALEGMSLVNGAVLIFGFEEIEEGEKVDQESETATTANLDPAADDEDLLDRLELYENIISENADEYSVAEETIKAMISQESDGDKSATDGLGSYGLMQVTQIAAQDVSDIYNDDEHQALLIRYLADPYNPAANIQIGTAYYALLRNHYSSEGNYGDDLKKITLAAYNWGRGNIASACVDEKWENCEDIPGIVLQYVSNVLAYEQDFAS
ncbi:lytic transglycosylase domain-containing protein, partial [Nanoarchaeota archaeon]